MQTGASFLKNDSIVFFFFRIWTVNCDFLSLQNFVETYLCKRLKRIKIKYKDFIAPILQSVVTCLLSKSTFKILFFWRVVTWVRPLSYDASDKYTTTSATKQTLKLHRRYVIDTNYSSFHCWNLLSENITQELISQTVKWHYFFASDALNSSCGFSSKNQNCDWHSFLVFVVTSYWEAIFIQLQ